MICLCCRQTLTSSWGICSTCEAEIEHLRFARHTLSTFDPPPHWDALCTVSPYYYPLDNFIKQFKFNQKKELAKPLAHLMFRSWYFFSREQSLIPPEVIIGVPMHKDKKLQRTFNQTEELAKYLSHWLSIPHITDHIEHRKTAFDQKQLSRQARHTNTEHAFALRQEIRAKTVLLVDDVITTGSTLNALSNLLKQHGVTTVYTLCLCQTT